MSSETNKKDSIVEINPKLLKMKKKNGNFQSKKLDINT